MYCRIIIFYLTLFFLPFFSFGQYYSSQNYYESYAFYETTFLLRNEVVIPIDFYIWQDQNGENNYVDNAYNNQLIQQTVQNINRFFIENPDPTFNPFPKREKRTTTKIHFVLKNIRYVKNQEAWKEGENVFYSEGARLNHIADSIFPKTKNNFKIHITTANGSPSGYASIPSENLAREQFIVTYNKREDTLFRGENSDESAWAFAIHLAHEMAHNFDLYHNYDDGHCDESDPDYLDDVFGSSSNRTKVCPQEGGWGCDYLSPSTTCTNNIMGGTMAGRYFSPKQIARMHRALAIKSIGNYAVPYQFNSSKFITIKDSTAWDFNMKFFTTIRIQKGATLVVKRHLKLASPTKIVIEKGGKLIVDGGLISDVQSYKNFRIQQKQLYSQPPIAENKAVQLRNKGRIDNSVVITILNH